MTDNAVHLARLSDDGFRNMAVDEYLLELCRRGVLDAALRFYEWRPPAVSLGYSQPLDLLDLGACRKQGIDVVKRITGGGAILHCQELTYCFVLRRGSAVGGAWPRETANAVSRSLVTGLSELGIRASTRSRTRPAVGRSHEARAGVEGGDVSTGRIVTDLCFMSGAENEIEACGRKLAGCAHKFTREAFFSHGSIMTGPAHVQIARLVRPEGGHNSDGLARDMAEKSVSLTELLSRAPTADDMEPAFKRAFEGVFGLRFTPISLSPTDVGLVEERAEEKRSVLAAALRANESIRSAH